MWRNNMHKIYFHSLVMIYIQLDEINNNSSFHLKTVLKLMSAVFESYWESVCWWNTQVLLSYLLVYTLWLLTRLFFFLLYNFCIFISIRSVELEHQTFDFDFSVFIMFNIKPTLLKKKISVLILVPPKNICQLCVHYFYTVKHCFDSTISDKFQMTIVATKIASKFSSITLSRLQRPD